MSSKGLVESQSVTNIGDIKGFLPLSKTFFLLQSVP